MKKLILLLVLLPALAIAQGAKKPEWISVAGLFERYTETNDIAYLYLIPLIAAVLSMKFILCL